MGRGKVLGQPVIQQIAERRGLSEAAVILRWVMQKGVVPLVQTTKRKNAEGNLAALDFTLSEVEMNSISIAQRKKRAVYFRWFLGSGLE